jgi:hypothetical protein
MLEPTVAQLRSIHIQCHILTNVMFQPIHIVRLDERTGNIFILAGQEELLAFEIDPQGILTDDEQV